MPAIITKSLKRKLTQLIFDEVTSASNRYYIGIGKSEAYDSAENVTTPIDTIREERNARAGMQSLKSAADCSFVVPRYNWSSGTIYQSFDDNFAIQPSPNSFYVLTEDNQVYICIQQSKNADGAAQASTVKPTGTTTKAFKTSDGYVWKYMFTLTAARANKFLSANFLPVEKILDSANVNTLTGTSTLSALEILQAKVQDSAVPGQIINVQVTNGGTGYTSTPSVTIVGNGANATATATVNSGAVTKVELDSSADSGLTFGQGFTFGSAIISGGGGNGAAARIILGPDSGIGSDPRNELLSSSIMFNTKPTGIEDSNFIVNQDFRQVMLVRDPKVIADSALTAASGKALSFLQVTSVSDAAAFNLDTIILGTTSFAKAHVDEVDSDRIYFHQSEETLFRPFQEGETISGGGNTATLVGAGVDANTLADSNDDVDKLSGDLFYIENRAPVFRTSAQTEDIKIVITL